MSVGDDFKVSRRFREEVSDLASLWRQADPSTATANRFDVDRFLMEYVLPALGRQGRVITLEIVNDDVAEPDAWVDFVRSTLSVQRSIWVSASQNEEHGRLVLAHEIGHLILHGDQVLAFSRGQEKKLGFLDASESAECQANWFAASLLIPDPVFRRLSHLDDHSIATLTLVADHAVRIRRRDFELDKRNRNYTGDECPRCQNFTVAMRGIVAVCQHCNLEIASA